MLISLSGSLLLLYIVDEMRGLTYVLRNKLYIALTNKCVSTSPLQLHGPSFSMPPSANFNHLEIEPTAKDVFDAVEGAFAGGRIGISSMDSDEITFAGVGEPLLKLDVLTSAAQLITEARHGAQLRVKTNGLILSKECSQARSLYIATNLNPIFLVLLTPTIILYHCTGCESIN